MPAVSPAMSMGPGGGRGSAAAAPICLRQAPCRATALAVCSARLCHKCQRSATWTAAGAPSRAPSAWAPARQHVDGSPGGSAGQDGGVDVAVAQREVIDADHVRRRTGHRVGQAEDQPQQRAAVHRDTQRSGQPHPGPLRQLERDLGQ